MSPDEVPCFGDFCKKGLEFCDALSRFCLSCASSPWSEKCFTSEHISSCTDFCRALESGRSLQSVSETESYLYWTIPLMIIVLALVPILITVSIRRWIPQTWNNAIQSLKVVFPCYIRLCGRDEATGPGIQEDEEAGMIPEEDRPPIQATPDGAASDPSTHPKYGFTTCTPHEETELIQGTILN